MRLLNCIKKYGILLLSGSFFLASCGSKSKLKIAYSDKFDGKTVELISYADSVVLAKGEIEDGELEFELNESDSLRFPLFTSVMVDGRIRAFYILEPGTAVLTDSMSVASGTVHNDEFSGLLAKLDSVENLDDLNKYVGFAEELYNAHKDTPYRDYFGVEWLKYADPQRVDSFMNTTAADFRESPRVKSFENLARHRQQTAPGNKYVDFTGENSRGLSQTLSSMIVPGHYTLLDFWASWCPYCIKELPDLMEIYEEYGPKGLDIIGVAVRDKPQDTKAIVKKRSIPWKIMYNAQKTPYDIYGFSGIPEHILLDGEGNIVSRGENLAQIKARLEASLK